jgi:acyl carrier protein
VHAALGIDIPDADAARLTTLDQLIDYCTARQR